MKKVFAIILMAIMLVSTLSVVAACDFGNDELTVVFYHTMGSNLREVLDRHIAEFNKIYPNITIEHKQEGSYDDVRNKVNQELMVGKGPTMAYCYADHVALYNMGYNVIDLNTYINSEEVIPAGSEFGNKEEVHVGMTKAQVDDFIDGYLAEGTQFADTTQQLTLPFSKSTEVLYYNKTFFDKHKDVIEVPTHWWCPETGHENCKSSMEYVCAEIKKIDPNSIPLGYDSEANWFITMCEQLGTDYTSAVPKQIPLVEGKATHYTFYNEENIEFLERLNTWSQNKWVTTQQIYGSYTSNLFKEVGSGTKSYMSIGSSAGATHQRPDKKAGKYPFDVNITSIPQVDANNPKVISQGPSICILDTGSDTKLMATWLFVKYLTTSVAFQTEFSEASGYMPVLESCNDRSLIDTDPAIKAYIEDFLDIADGGDNIAALSAKVAMEQKDYYYASPAFVGSSIAREQVEILLTNILNLKGENLHDQIANSVKKVFETCEYLQPSPQP